jgi:hypothetical protein
MRRHGLRDVEIKPLSKLGDLEERSKRMKKCIRRYSSLRQCGHSCPARKHTPEHTFSGI